MIKAVVLEYGSTVIKHSGYDYNELIKRFIANSDLETEREVLHWLYQGVARLEKEAVGEQFRTREQLFHQLFSSGSGEIHLHDDLNELLLLLRNCAIYEPVYEDVKDFLRKTKKPVYMLCRESEDCVKVNLRRNSLHIYGLISCEKMKAYPPESNSYKAVLNQTGFESDEMCLISGDYEMTLKGAEEYGMKTILLDRHNKYKDTECRKIRSLKELRTAVRI